MYRKERNKVLIIGKGISLILIRSHSHLYTEIFSFFYKHLSINKSKVTFDKNKMFMFYNPLPTDRVFIIIKKTELIIIENLSYYL